MKYFLFLLLLGITFFDAMAQKITADELADRNEHLENLLLDYKEKLVFANVEIARLTHENEVLKQRINVLLSKERKTEADIDMLKEERKMLLINNQMLKRTIEEREQNESGLKSENQRLKLDNQLMTNANRLLEQAGYAADTIQKYQEYQIANQREVIRKMTLNYAGECAKLTGLYKIPLSTTRLTILLDEGKAPKPKELESMTITACYQIQGEVSSEKIIVYFQLYDNNKKEVVREVAFPLNRTNSEAGIHHFEGDFTLPTDKNLVLDLNEYFYEIKYLEQVIAFGHLKS